jgi:hypothetical protein
MNLAAVVVVASMLTWPSIAAAQYVRAEGVFASKGLTANVVVLDSERGVAAASIAVVRGQCSGSVAGLGQFNGRELVVQPYGQTNDDGACKVMIAYDLGWNTITVRELHCTSYRGAACGWEGQRATRQRLR